MSQYFLALIFVIIGFLAGLILEKVVLKKLKELAQKTAWDGDDIFVTAFKGATLFFCLIAGFYAALLTISVTPALLALLEKGLLALIILVMTIVLARMTSGFVTIYANKRRGVLPASSIFINITKFSIYLIGALIILQSLSISITPILTALGVGGLAVALALQDTLSNLFSGLHIIVSRQVKIGDYVKLSSAEEGYVADITWRNTTIRALPNNMIIVPNSKLASAIITNYNQPEKELAVRVSMTVSYQSDLEKVERVTIETAKEIMKGTAGGIPDFEPLIRFQSFGESGIHFSVIMRAKEFVDQYLIIHEFIKKLHERYRREGIEIPFPTRTLYMKSKIDDSAAVPR